ncbi:MAG: alpha/beta hydrolase [Chloroflexi bacterium]|nr:alpha/beta hydrolase [Chloroflexota bacterium]MBP7593340.1 alpha/beta hydrolase [Chloroflexota bacterium]
MLRLINQFVYRPEATAADAEVTPADLGLAYEAVTLTTADKLALSAWYLPAAAPRCLLLYCHGNAGDIRDWVPAVPPFVAAGCSVLLFDYRGYGQSAGRPSEEGLYLDGESAWAWAQQRAAQENVPAVILGKSLGTAVAIHIAAQTPPAALILDSAFASMREIAMTITPWLPDAMFPRLYESEKRVTAVTCPTLVIHGQADTLVALSHGQRIFAALTAPKTMHIIPDAGHNDVSGYPEYLQAIQAFLDGYLA